ncbi:MAG TPA: hypothetical protein VK623_03250 [Flavobacterium sp.]|nr:hypothetical protein [Flavobacterium sp.]
MNKKVAILATNGFEQSELQSPKDLQAFNRKMVEEIEEGIHNR